MLTPELLDLLGKVTMLCDAKSADLQGHAQAKRLRTGQKLVEMMHLWFVHLAGLGTSTALIFELIDRQNRSNHRK